MFINLLEDKIVHSAGNGRVGLEEVGGKARHLHWLGRHGYRIPASWVVTSRLGRAYSLGDEPALAGLRQELEQRLDPAVAYAVRSSASLEDDPRHSFAGQFLSLLDVPAREVYPAVVNVIESTNRPTVQAYLQKNNLPADSLSMAVIVQEMVSAQVSGVVFSKNPMTGLDEIVVEAVTGSGEALVQEGVTPSRWVNRWGQWLAQPANGSIPHDLIEQVVAGTRRIARSFGAPVDLEWVFDGQVLYWVQLRPITRLDQVKIYSNRISREVFPGQIKPLVWSVNVPLVNSSWIDLLSELIGPNDLQPQGLSKAFAYRAYFNMGALGQIFTALGMPAESLELLLGLPGGDDRPRFKPSARTWRHTPRMLRFLVNKLGVGRRVLPTLVKLRQEYASLQPDEAAALDEAGLLRAIDQLYAINRRAAYLNIIVPLLMGAYNALLRRQLTSAGVDYTYFDLMAGMQALEDYDPTVHLKRLAEGLSSLEPANRQAFAALDYEQFQSLPGQTPQLAGFQRELEAFIDQFGHLSENGNDFSAMPWRENRSFVMSMIFSQVQHAETAEVRTHLEFPVEGGKPPAEGRLAWQDLRLSRWQRLRMQPIYQQARRFRLYREAVSFSYTYGYGLFRVYFLALGSRLQQRGLLASAGDIFYLSWDEVRTLVEEPSTWKAEFPASELIRSRREDMQQSAGLLLPEVIYGDQLPPLEAPGPQSRTLTGIPSSRGYYRGAVRVIRQAADFDKLQRGEVLVIPYSDVSWTPLFTRAGAVIAEAGGILSHSSIVAREYNLPCVVSVSGACRLPDGIEVSVDGYKGAVHIHTHEVEVIT